jgi:hypothetical protein
LGLKPIAALRGALPVLLGCLLAACGGDDERARTPGATPDARADNRVNPSNDAGSDASAQGDAGTDASVDGGEPGDSSVSGDSATDADDAGDATGSDSGSGNDAGATCPTGGPAPTGNATSDQLIDQAEKAGRINDEQALIFKVFSVFGDPRLCAEFKALPSPEIGTPLMFEIARQFPNLSPTTRAILAPYFLPPLYEASAYAALARGQQPLPLEASEDDDTLQAPGDPPPIAHCGVGTNSDTKARRVTAHANIYYTKREYDPFGLHEYTAGVIAQHFENIYAKETTLFDRFPLSDGSLPLECNGGDGALDIYTYYFGDPGPLAPEPIRGVTIPYLASCTTPSFMLLQVESTQDPAAMKIHTTLAHEFFHVLQNGSVNGAGTPYTFSANCNDYNWLGEATANWVIDYIFARTNQHEQKFAPDYMGRERKVSLDKAFAGDESSPNTANGYTDYVFLLYLVKKYDPSKIKAIWDATQSADSVGALKAAGDLQTIWHQFALATWNDHRAGIQHEFFQWDGLEAGVKAAFDKEDGNPPPGLTEPSTKIELRGASDAKFDLMKTMRTRGLERLSVHYDYLKFTDDAVSYLRFENLFGGGYKIQALKKIGGTWRAVEDWSFVGFKELCRDKRDERLEELVLVYSNGIAERSAPAIPVPMPATLQVSNVGCLRWSGNSSFTISSPEVIEESSATSVVYERVDHGSAYTSDPQIDFRPISGTAFYQLRPAPGAMCRISTPRVSGAIELTDSLLLFPVPTPTTPSPGRLVDGNFEATATDIPTTRTVECGGPSMSGPWPAISGWLMFPDMGKAPVSADGRTLAGSKTETFTEAGITVSYTTQWNYRAERE